LRVRGAPRKRPLDFSSFAKGPDGSSGAPRTRFFFKVSPRAQIGRRELLENGILICQVSQRAQMGHRELPENGISTFQVLQQAQMGHRELPENVILISQVLLRAQMAIRSYQKTSL